MLFLATTIAALASLVVLLQIAWPPTLLCAGLILGVSQGLAWWPVDGWRAAVVWAVCTSVGAGAGRLSATAVVLLIPRSVDHRLIAARR
jgi:hypothetical protein